MVDDTECPYIPEGATDLEAAEIRRCWRQAMTFYSRLGRAAERAVADLVAGRISDGGSTAADASQAAAATAEMRGHIAGVQRRLRSTP